MTFPILQSALIYPTSPKKVFTLGTFPCATKSFWSPNLAPEVYNVTPLPASSFRMAGQRDFLQNVTFPQLLVHFDDKSEFAWQSTGLVWTITVLVKVKTIENTSPRRVKGTVVISLVIQDITTVIHNKFQICTVIPKM